jgi:hypothetical protein
MYATNGQQTPAVSGRLRRADISACTGKNLLREGVSCAIIMIYHDTIQAGQNFPVPSFQMFDIQRLCESGAVFLILDGAQ